MIYLYYLLLILIYKINFQYSIVIIINIVGNVIDLKINLEIFITLLIFKKSLENINSFLLTFIFK